MVIVIDIYFGRNRCKIDIPIYYNQYLLSCSSAKIED